MIVRIQKARGIAKRATGAQLDILGYPVFSKLRAAVTAVEKLEMLPQVVFAGEPV
jgi:hypothetical protein